ncbi:AAA family ATPase [Thermogemmatispora onikobensis]|uniref:bifunctional aminoglycoside phosphotransferase/ATP-binding protein n=1 Tax=Thermogemmatispora onikobensis TaxID=732234 RepID=UPI000853D0D3|nr:AAA family ATPase [Thermogemmatispora onikobensis]
MPAPSVMQAAEAMITTILAGKAPARAASAQHQSTPAASAPHLVQTHASVVVLLPDLVYKLKKPVNLGFLDYSTPMLRRQWCREEVLVNAPLAPGIYLGVAPIVRTQREEMHIGPIFSPESVPEPASSLEEGTVVDYAVVMRRLPETATLAGWLQSGRLSAAMLEAVARRLAAFHAEARADDEVRRYGQPELLAFNWQETLTQLQPYLGRTLDQSTYEQIQRYVEQFLAQRRALLLGRIAQGCIRDGHGDLRLQHVYWLESPPEDGQQEPQLLFLDRIEFNTRFRYADIAAEVAFLAMELEYSARVDLADAFVDAYVRATEDESLREVLPFYLCYRACVRGKVASLLLDEPEVPLEERDQAQQQASALFALAAHYASRPAGATLVMIGGLMGTGKSTLARTLQQTTGAALFSSDVIRKRLAGLAPGETRAEAFGKGIYAPAWGTRTYQALHALAILALQEGRSVILDASFLRREDRQIMAQAAAAQGVPTFFIECFCPKEEALARLRHRWSQRQRIATPGLSGVGELSLRSSTVEASDGRPDLYDAQCAHWQPCLPATEQITGVPFRTDRPLPVLLAQLLDILGQPCLACRLVLP